MIYRTRIAAIAACLLIGSATAASPLIPREMLFGAPARSLPEISPDGTKLAYLGRDAYGSMHIWLTPVSHPQSRGTLLTDQKDADVFGFRWAEDNVHILYWRDKDGDENWHLFELDTRNRQICDLMPEPEIKAQNLLTDARHPHEILVGLNIRDRAAVDMYRVNLDTGMRTLDTRNPGDVLSWTADAQFKIREATAFSASSGATVLRVRKTEQSPWQNLVSWPFEASVMFGQVNGGSIAPAFTPDGKAVFAVSANGADNARLVRIGLSSRRWTLVASGDGDIAQDSLDAPSRMLPADYRPLIMISPSSGKLQAVAFERADRSWHPIDPAIGADLEILEKRLGAFPYVVSRDRSDRHWIVTALSSDRPLGYSLYDRATKALHGLFSEHPELSRRPLPRTVATEILARDGLTIPVYLTRKPGNVPAPLILYPHGGPWFRDHLDFNPIVQLLADRGYAVLQVEYRGSTGFGKAFLNAGNHEYGLKMRDDLIDATEWAIKSGIADKKRVGVFGISAGGYLALRVTEGRPDLYRTTVDLVGPTDVRLSLESFPPTWTAVRARWLRRIGDVIHDDALNDRMSPRFSGQRPMSAFLIAQGANDSRVDPSDSRLITNLLRSKGAQVTSLTYDNEGHIFTKPETKLDLYGRLEEFFAKTLGGDAQPWIYQPRAEVEETDR